MAHSHMGCMSPRDYFTEQLLTILVCGAMSIVGIQMYLNGMLFHILAPDFHPWVLFGSIGVLALVVLRAVSVWREAGELQPVDGMNCQENHVHTASCNHTLPGMPDGSTTDPNLVEDPGHSHDMSWVFARMLVLVFPVALFALGVPNASISAQGQLDGVKDEKGMNLEELAKDPGTTVTKDTETQTDGTKVRELLTADGLKIREITTPKGEVNYIPLSGQGNEMRFNDLTEAALDADKRKSYGGQTAIMEGRFKRLADKEFTLFRMKMTCCGADTVPLKVRILTPQAINGFNDFDWVRVKGVIQFIKAPGQDRYVPVLALGDVTDVQKVPLKNEYEY